MNSLIQTRPSVQFRCRVEAGQLRYEQIVRVEGEVDNYQPAASVVVQNAWNEFYRKPEADKCESLTAGSEIVAVSPFELSAGSQSQAALSTSARIMSMVSASAHYTSLNAISGN